MRASASVCAREREHVRAWVRAWAQHSPASSTVVCCRGRRHAVLQLTMRDARWLQASRLAAQAAQVAENTLLRDGIVLHFESVESPEIIFVVSCLSLRSILGFCGGHRRWIQLQRQKRLSSRI